MESQKPVEQRLETEKMRQVVTELFRTLGIDNETDIGRFDECLETAIKDLPRYKELERRLSGLEGGAFVERLSSLLNRAADEEMGLKRDDSLDGVFIESIRKGGLECAGRVMIGSALLREKGIPHAVTKAPGHTFIIVEEGPETLGYLDANNDIYFTFPKSALGGWAGPDAIAEVKLNDFAKRDTDVVRGQGSVYREFLTMPAKRGIQEMYIGNLAAAFAGKEEFLNSGIAADPEKEKSTHDLSARLLGKDETGERFYAKLDDLKVRIQESERESVTIIRKLYADHPGKDAFVAAMTDALKGALGESRPQIRNSEEGRMALAERAWEILQRHPEKLDEMEKIR